jgi:hypothetical protein
VNEEGKVVAELGDEKWLWDLALLCDQPARECLNTKFQEQLKLISNMFGVVKDF